MNIRKVVIELTILYDASIDPPPQNLRLSEVVHEMDEGDLIGQSRCMSDEPVVPEAVEEELLSLGNDGKFFDYE
jgi:hypothetical protein